MLLTSSVVLRCLWDCTVLSAQAASMLPALMGSQSFYFIFLKEQCLVTGTKARNKLVLEAELELTM